MASVLNLRGDVAAWLWHPEGATGAVVLGLLPAPYVIEKPGPVYDTLGEVTLRDGTEQPVIEISGAPTYPTDGELNLLTVLVTGSREMPPSWIEVASAWFQSSRAVVPIDAIYPDGQTDEEDLGVTYDQADQILNWVLSGFSAEEITARGFDAKAVDTVRRRLDSTHWKRRLSTVAMLTGTSIGDSYLRPVDY